MLKIWTTKEGVEIEYSKLEDSHLLNILKWIKNRSKKGMTVMCGGGVDAEDIWFDEWEIKGKEVLERYNYKGLLKEAKKRKLLIN